MSEPKTSPWAGGDAAMREVATRGERMAFATLRTYFDEGMDSREQAATVGLMMSMLLAAHAITRTDEAAEKSLDEFLALFRGLCLKRRQYFKGKLLAGDPATLELLEQITHKNFEAPL